MPRSRGEQVAPCMVLPVGIVYTTIAGHNRRKGNAMLEIAVLGAGRIGRIHAGNIAAHPGARLTGIADTDPDSANLLATSLGVKPLSAAEAMKADAVLIASPTPTHASYIEQA